MSRTQNPNFTVHFPPKRPTITQPSVILFGAIESSPTENWATTVTDYVSHLAVTVLNPRCVAWDATWREDVNFAPFKEQVEWEIDHAAIADKIVFYFKPDTLCPVSLMELGMHGAKYPEKCIVCCPKDFYKRGNVEIVCQKLGIAYFVEELKDVKPILQDQMSQLLTKAGSQK